MSKALDEPLICDVMLPPATIIKRGCDLRTLLVAINQRGNLPPAQRVLRETALVQQPAPVAEHHPLDHVEWWANAYEKEGGHAVIVDMLRAYRDMLAAAPAAPAPEAQEPVAWTNGQCREFVSVALRHVEVKGTLHAQDIRDALAYMAERGADVPAPPAAEQPDTVKVPRELLDLLREMIDLHKRRGCVLTAHMEHVEDLLAGGEA